MPLRLLAGVWMPMAQGTPLGMAHHPEATVSASQAPLAQAAHDCHEAVPAEMTGAVEGLVHQRHNAHEGHQVQPGHELQNTAVDAVATKADCHDGSCQLCGVCHHSGSLMAVPWALPIAQAQPWPVAVPQAHAAMVLPPLIKPPIS